MGSYERKDIKIGIEFILKKFLLEYNWSEWLLIKPNFSGDKIKPYHTDMDYQFCQIGPIWEVIAQISLAFLVVFSTKPYRDY